MKTKIGILLMAFCATFINAQAQRTVTTARATSYDISDNLDLDAVASIFGDSKNLEDFEERLNDPDIRISNLDLNQDGYIDYLRVVENSSERNSLVVIQAVLDKDVFQDVATIEIERVQDGNPRVQIIGDDYIYGSNYIIEPLFVRTPLIFSFFWSPRYTVWQSPYYWGYYPRWYSYYRPYPTFRYHRDVYVNINRHNTYRHVSDRNFRVSGDAYNHIRRNDYASQHPDRAFVNRNQGVRNQQELRERRQGNSGNYQNRNSNQRSDSRQIQEGRRPNSESGQRNGNEYRRPSSVNQSGSNQNRNRENNSVKSNSTNSRVQPNTQPTRRQENKPSVSRNQSTNKPAPNRTQNRIEPTKRSSSPTVKSAPRSNESRSRSVTKPTQKTVKSAPSKKTESKKESTERRRNR
ncbi:MAG: hypothetical protein WC384_04150 [Prolixibacteraceae bacterium]